MAENEDLREAIAAVDWESVLNCIEACQHDSAEPERYRAAYAKAFFEVKALISAASTEERDG